MWGVGGVVWRSGVKCVQGSLWLLYIFCELNFLLRCLEYYFMFHLHLCRTEYVNLNFFLTFSSSCNPLSSTVIDFFLKILPFFLNSAISSLKTSFGEE